MRADRAERAALAVDAARRIGASKFQALCRAHQSRLFYRFITLLRCWWRRLLKPDELVVLSMPVCVQRGGMLGGQRRLQLIVTSNRRVLLVDDGFDVVKDIAWNASTYIDVAAGSTKKFTIVHDKDSKRVVCTALAATSSKVRLLFDQF